MSDATLPELPDEFLAAEHAFIYGKPGEWAIRVSLRPFQLDGKMVETSFDFDAFPWNVAHPRQLAGSDNTYSDEQREEHNIEGSIYLRGGHNPCDITRVKFGDADAESIAIVLEFQIDFSVEGADFENRSARIVARAKYGAPRGIMSYRVIKDAVL